MIEVCGSTKRYGEVVAVEGLSFEVPPADMGQRLGMADHIARGFGHARSPALWSQREPGSAGVS
jgi:hypothetical protein